MTSRGMKMREGTNVQQPPATEIAQPSRSDATVAQEIGEMISRLEALIGPLRARPSPSGKPCQETIRTARETVALAEALINTKPNYPNLRNSFAALEAACDKAIIALDIFEERWKCA